jgi:bacterioferritin (cytochrome b1)
MADPRNIEILNRLLTLEYHSLPAYLAGTSPWVKQGEERAAATLAHIVADQQELAGRIARLIIKRDGQPSLGGFPMEFTDLHMLSLDFLIQECIRWEQRSIAEIEACIAQLKNDPEARLLAEEALGLSKGHLENLQETVKELV